MGFTRISSTILRQTVRPFLSVRHVSINRPAPLPLPQEDQREFEELLRKAQTPLAPSETHEPEIDLAVHPDARTPIKPAFEGDVNPSTGEQGGPKHEPVGQWTAESGGDWSFKGRVSDF
ncbi:hypothetical protein CPB83DRAFT_852551 [Crepidotus variabilis]|uniref:Succinate dehydrogenase assembly factor 4, mitochondrial n=1 Tax=Crepidotus variabilis TaxID=179855 RepID=A0A9P6JRA6_9AGAR|nr:hypothetical protein CPB83DRAFT_852551 [Crepidotus variabilis]